MYTQRIYGNLRSVIRNYRNNIVGLINLVPTTYLLVAVSSLIKYENSATAISTCRLRLLVLIDSIIVFEIKFYISHKDYQAGLTSIELIISIV